MCRTNDAAGNKTGTESRCVTEDKFLLRYAAVISDRQPLTREFLKKYAQAINLHVPSCGSAGQFLLSQQQSEFPKTDIMHYSQQIAA
jgi:hypothetical protein